MNMLEAVKLAQAYIAEFPELFPATSPRLEETQVDDEGHWQITISFLLPSDGGFQSERVYKHFEIDPKAKEVVAMRIRNPLVAAEW